MWKKLLGKCNIRLIIEMIGLGLILCESSTSAHKQLPHAPLSFVVLRSSAQKCSLVFCLLLEARLTLKCKHPLFDKLKALHRYVSGKLKLHWSVRRGEMPIITIIPISRAPLLQSVMSGHALPRRQPLYLVNPTSCPRNIWWWLCASWHAVASAIRVQPR